MAFDESIEYHFSVIVRDDLVSETTVKGYVFQVEDGGLDPETGEQLYVRTLLRTRNILFNNIVSDAQLETWAQAVLAQANTDFALGIPAGPRRIASL